MAHTSSPMPRVIMAKGVPAFLVVTQPSSTATSMLRQTAHDRNQADRQGQCHL